MQPKRSPLLLATAALGVLALGGLAYIFLPRSEQSSPPPGGKRAAVATPTPVANVRWVAAQDIPPRTRITRNMLAQAAVAGDVPKDAIKDLSDVQGELTNDAIARGETVQSTSFTQSLKRVVPANIEVPRGFRAVAIFVDPNSTAAGLVDVGDYVDVIAVHKLTVDKEKNQFVQGALQFSAGRLIGSDLKVLAVEKSLTAPIPTPASTPAAAGAPAVAAANGAPPPPTPVPPPSSPNAPAAKIRVILAAPVEIATRLVAAQDQGTLHVTIRNPIDGDQTLSPEAREYPSRIVTQREVKTAGQQIGKATGDGFKSSLGIGSGGRRSAPPLPDMNPTMPLPLSNISPGMPQTAPAPLPPAGTTPSMIPSVPSIPPVPKTRDITVIRGTEKTRVIVPAR